MVLIKCKIFQRTQSAQRTRKTHKNYESGKTRWNKICIFKWALNCKKLVMLWRLLGSEFQTKCKMKWAFTGWLRLTLMLYRGSLISNNITHKLFLLKITSPVANLACMCVINPQVFPIEAFSVPKMAAEIVAKITVLRHRGRITGGQRGKSSPKGFKKKKKKIRKYGVFSCIKVIKISFSVIFNEEIHALGGLLSWF